MSPAVITLIILVVAMVLFMTEAISMVSTAFLVAFSLWVFGIIDVGDIFANGISSNAILMLAMMVVGQAFFKTGMAYRTGKLMTKFAKNEHTLILGVVLFTGILSGFLSNACVLVTLLPIVCAIAQTSGIKPAKVLLPFIMATTLGANLSIIGSPNNMVAKNTLEELSGGAIQVGFFGHFAIGVPILIGLAVFLGIFGPKFLPGPESGKTVLIKEDYSDIPTWKAVASTIILVITIICMVLKDFISWLPAIHVTACIGGLLCVLTGILSEKEAFDAISIPAVLLMVFMLPLGTAMTSTGAGDMIANAIISIVGENSPFLVMMILWLVTFVLTQFMSNTAATTMLAPIAYVLATTLNIDPRSLVFAVMVAASTAFCTPIAVPTNVIIMEPANLRFKDFIVPGLITSAVIFVISMIFLPICFPFHP